MPSPYTPYLRGKMSVSFTATALGTAEAVFENLAHDFPKRIVYRRVAPDRLEARIEGARPNDPGGQSWLTKRQ
ncbi:MAG: hypothetical protein FJX59_00110 [Alphaproteobacteria bacterium]|nr:hypothetical protein [Alphaproteobacteria bacterium]